MSADRIPDARHPGGMATEKDSGCETLGWKMVAGKDFGCETPRWKWWRGRIPGVRHPDKVERGYE